MNTYTFYWTPENQSALLAILTWLEVQNAVWLEEPEYPHFALVQEVNGHQYDEALEQCGGLLAGIKPGSNPGGSPTGCA